MSGTRLGSRFDDALVFASELHRPQRRKGNNSPYLAHLLSVAAIVIENGGDEDAAIAALLHDASEDQGGLATVERIRERFGDRVARIVLECSDNDGEPKRPWRERKENFIATIETLSPQARIVALADKLHNVRSLMLDYRTYGDQIWTHFNGARAGTAWYYRAALRAFQRGGDEPLVRELESSVEMFLKLIGEAGIERFPGRVAGLGATGTGE